MSNEPMAVSQQATHPRSGYLGLLSLIAVAAWDVPILIDHFFRQFMSTRIRDNISIIFFDHGLAIDIILLLVCVAGISKRGRSGRFALIALVLLIGGELLLFL
jgi:hypothetical protein